MFFIYLWRFDVKYVQFSFEPNQCNYHDVILHKIMWFLCIKHAHSCMSFLKMSHSFDYLRYWIQTNIIHLNNNMKFVQFLYELMKFEICTKFVWTYEAQ
jgi:hypothetical protein